MTKEDLEKLGWHTYYHYTHWVHPSHVPDDTDLDYVQFGTTFESAVYWEEAGRPKLRFASLTDKTPYYLPEESK